MFCLTSSFCNNIICRNRYLQTASRLPDLWPYSVPPSQAPGPVAFWHKKPITVAGQYRILTCFPFRNSPHLQSLMKNILTYSSERNKYFQENQHLTYFQESQHLMAISDALSCGKWKPPVVMQQNATTSGCLFNQSKKAYLSFSVTISPSQFFCGDQRSHH